MLFQSPPWTEMQTHIQYKAYSDETCEASKKTKSNRLCVTQAEADLDGSNISFIEFPWIVRNNVQKVLPSTNYIFSTVGKQKTQVLPRMGPQFMTPMKPVIEKQTSSEDWKLEPSMNKSYDNLYAGAWESEFEEPDLSMT